MDRPQVSSGSGGADTNRPRGEHPLIWHPLVLAFGTAAATGAYLYGIAALLALDVASDWRPGATDAPQLRREARAERAGLLGFGAFICLSLAAAIGLTGIALEWSRSIPGAMCGTGVLQAMGPAGRRALILWAITLTLLYGWRVLERLDETHPQRILTGVNARVLLVSAPFLVLTLFHSAIALLRIDTPLPVSCCAAIYDTVLAPPSEARVWLTPIFSWVTLAGAILPPVVAARVLKSPFRKVSIIVPFLAFVWAAVSVESVGQTWSAYYYQVLSHPCPWCLFLPEHLGAGFPVFGCLALAFLESIAFWAADRARHLCPFLADAANGRQRRALWRMTAAIIGFTILSAGPAILWRIKNGVWLDGSF